MNYGPSLTMFALYAAAILPSYSAASSNVDDLKGKIEERENQIKALQIEVEKYNVELSDTEREAKTLNSEVLRLNSILSKLQTDTKVTQQKIEFSDLTIAKLNLNINQTQTDIKNGQVLLADLLRLINEAAEQSFIEILLANNSISGFFDNIERVENLQKASSDRLDTLRHQKNELQSEMLDRENEKLKYLALKDELDDRKKIESETRNEKAGLLKTTKQKESSYRTLLAEKARKIEALEKEITAIEEQIRVVFDPALLPNPSSGILEFPLPDVSLKFCQTNGITSKNCVTQYFGNTSFATENPQIYSTGGHNGIDFRAVVGTEVLNSYDGIVRAIGNTDDHCRGVSYGKWVLIDHPNNLSTLYAHLARSSVYAGQEVKRGERIGYSGQSGYATGPHLHFAVFAREAVQITSLNPGDKYYYKSKICGTPLYMPVSPPNGYLNPLSYL